jgi:hypothetical protein
MKNKKSHFHVCPDGHKWQCKNAGCNLSIHAHCGFSRFNDYTTCVRNKAPIPPRYSFEANPFGFNVLYRGTKIAKGGLTAKEKKIKRNKKTLNKQEKEFAKQAENIIEQLENGKGDRRIWSKIRKADRQLTK